MPADPLMKIDSITSCQAGRRCPRAERLPLGGRAAYAADMAEPEPSRPQSPQERRRRLIGRALEHDEDDIAFWREASDELRGEALYRLLAQARAIRAAAPPAEERERLILRPGGREIRRRV